MTNKFEKNQLDQINEVSLFTPIIQAILKRKTDKKARELKKDPKLAATYKGMEDAIHAFQRSLDVYIDSTASMLKTQPEDDHADIEKEWDKRMKSFGPEIYKKWKKENRQP